VVRLWRVRRARSAVVVVWERRATAWWGVRVRRFRSAARVLGDVVCVMFAVECFDGVRLVC